ncbi:MAG: hypothetical protein KC535_05545 [Nanoarchaeota archaeon]|nr:hypothetical protein [Nanoarchaeota archaeon]
MCDFHLKGQCFHPEKTKKGFVATSCQFHDCSQCTNKIWQKNMIEENYSYYQSIVELTQNKEAEIPESVEKRQPILTRIFSAKS